MHAYEDEEEVRVSLRDDNAQQTRHGQDDEEDGYSAGDERRLSAVSRTSTGTVLEDNDDAPYSVPPPADDGLGSGSDEDDPASPMPAPPPVPGQPMDMIAVPPSRRTRDGGMFRRSTLRAASMSTKGIIDLRHESVDELIEDLELYADEFTVWRVNSATSRARLDFARKGLVEAADMIRQEHPEVWTSEVVSRFNKTLKMALRNAHGEDVVLEDSMFAVVLKDRDNDYLRSTISQKTFFRHEINLRECSRVAAGWMCLFFVCYAPWFATIATLYRTSTSEGPSSQCNDGEKKFLFIFMCFLGVNFFLNCGAACVATYDRGVICVDKNYTRRWVNRIIGLFTAMFVCFNVYGLTIWWVPSGRQSTCTLRPMTLAVIVAFLVLPCFCFGVQTIFQVGDTRRKRNAPAKLSTGNV